MNYYRQIELSCNLPPQNGISILRLLSWKIRKNVRFFKVQGFRHVPSSAPILVPALIIVYARETSWQTLTGRMSNEYWQSFGKNRISLTHSKDKWPNGDEYEIRASREKDFLVKKIFKGKETQLTWTCVEIKLRNN